LTTLRRNETYAGGWDWRRVSEFLVVSLMAKKFQLPIVPHVGDMGQIHQHLVLFNHVALNDEVHFIEHIPHLQKHFIYPAQVIDGYYKPPQDPGASIDMRLESGDRYPAAHASP
jgi:L-fuconate dehydratase